MPHPSRLAILLLALLPLAACDHKLPIESFADTTPLLTPETWFLGQTKSWGVFEDSAGAPVTGRFGTDCEGHAEPDGTLVLAQTVHLADGGVQLRTWRLRRTDAHHYAATAAPVEGIARGEAYGRAFHWTYTLRLPPGDWLHTVQFEHWMYLSDDGSQLLNRFTVRKLGIVVARASELFGHVPAPEVTPKGISRSPGTPAAR
jgi:hypothetical protein